MSKTAFHILRVGLAITFLWIGILILKQPEAWASYIAPWAAGLLPVSPVEAMQGTAVLDLAIGLLLLTDTWVWLAALIGALHLITVLAVSGITDITVRDIAIFAGAVALFVETRPKNLLIKQKTI
ncbi:MAG: hypothetical protein AAB500_00780 [Patescibacteria group bacterium]